MDEQPHPSKVDNTDEQQQPRSSHVFKPDETGHDDENVSEGRHRPSRMKTHEQELAEAAEHRKLWAMAATSVANLIKEFSDKPIPNLEALRQSFQPSTPDQWLKRMEASNEDAMAEQDSSMEETDTEAPVELFYDIDANDDDLKAFLGDSDEESVVQQPSVSQTTAISKRKSTIAPKKLVDKVISAARKSLAPIAQATRESEDADLESPPGSKTVVTKRASSTSAVDDGSQHGSQVRISGTDGRRGTADSANEKRESDRQRTSALQPVASYEDDWDFDEVKPSEETMVEDDGDALFQVTDVDYDINELAKGLESLLDDLQLEARITERYKYKLVNKFNLLLHALVSTHDREYEIMQHLQTKRKILNVLNNFVKTEVEMSTKVVISEEKSEEDLDQAMVLDFHKGERKSGDDGATEDTGKHDEGLSIEEMNASTIRDTLLRQKNKLDVLEAIKKIHVLKLKQKEFERTLLTLHYSKMVKPTDLHKEIKEARRLVNDLQLDISSLHQEMGQIQTDVRIQEKSVNDEEKIVEKLELEALTKQGEVAILQTKPILMQKEGDREGAKLEYLQDLYQKICQKQLDNMDSFRSFTGKIDKLDHDFNALLREEVKLANQKKNSVREIERLMTQMEALITREQIMLDKAAQMTEKIQQANKQKKKIHDEQQKIFNEASKALRITQRLERSIKMASEAFINARLAHEKMRAAFDAAKPSEEDSNWQRLSHMLERDITNLKLNLEKKLEESAIKGSMVDRLKLKLNELYDDQVSSGKELQELIRTTVRKRREREEKSEQCIKLDSQIQRFDQDIKMRELIIEDCQRSCKDLAKLVEVMKGKIGIVKLEKSAVLNDITINKEKLVEARSVLKSLENDMKVIGQRLLDLEKELKDQHYLILNARLARDSVRNDTLRSRDKFRYHRNQKEELLLGNKMLRRDLQRQKSDIATIKKDFEEALAECSSIAINVRERLGEICTFTEYIRSYDKILLRGANEITVRELERTKLLSLADELRKHVLIVKINQPDESVFFNKIEKLRKEFYEITEQRRTLELQLNEDDNPQRVREINFDLMKTRENIPVLEKKLNAIEELLASRDAIGLERTLLENHVTRITDDSLFKALKLKQKFGPHVKARVTIRKNLSQVSRQIDGLICENSIASTQADTAETMYIYFRKELAEAEENCAKGLPPNKAIHEEWKRLQWKKEMLRRAYQKQSGFLRPIKHKQGYQVNSEKLRKTCRRKLEDPTDSALGWSFSVEQSRSASAYRPPLELKFQNSAMNPRLSCTKRGVLPILVSTPTQKMLKPKKLK